MTQVQTDVRYTVIAGDSWMSIAARTTLHGVEARTTAMTGYVEAELRDGAIATDPPPAMHLEFAVEALRSGNPLQDREIFKLIDSRRFPRILADLRTLARAGETERYDASGDITLAGRSRPYRGQLTIAAQTGGLTIDGGLTVDIRDFGLKPPRLLLLSVDPVLRATLHVVASASA